MTLRAEPSWQLLLADLWLILFLATAAALAAQSGRTIARAGEEMTAAPVALFRPQNSQGELAAWIVAYRPDPREALTIRIRHRPGDLPAALARAGDLAEEARHAGQTARIVLEEGAQGDAFASFAFEGTSAARADTGTQIAQSGGYSTLQEP